MANKVKAVLIGGTGYGGAEILRRLLFNPNVEVVRVTIDVIGAIDEAVAADLNVV